MRVAIVGSGVGGLSTAHSLSRLPFVSSIKIIDKGTNNDKMTDNSYTGLWNPALSILCNYGIDIDSKVCFVNKSGYKGVDGRWLAQPKKGLGKGLFDSPCLGFLKNSDLLKALSSSLPPSIDIIKEDLESIDTKNNIITVRTSDGKEYEVDLVLGCDGKNSSVRNTIHKDNHTLQYRGYEVYRGHSTSLFHFAYKQRISEEAFQTWGEGIRFATVPTNEGNAWFLACSKVTANSNSSSKGCHNVISNDKFQELQRLVSNWHQPVLDLLANTDNGYRGVIVCDAYGSSTNSRQSVVLNNNTGVAFVGDASYTLDPILAQGTGLAIEHSYLLSKALKMTYTTNGLTQALKHYDEMKAERKLRLHYLSDLSQSIGNIHDKNITSIRDNIMANIYRYFPNLMGSGFDKIIEYSSSNRHVDF